MSVGTAYTPLRDDTNQRSLSNNERLFLRSCATCVQESSVLRCDGRDANEVRPIRLTFGRSHNLAECTVQFGATTRVSAVVGCHLTPPTNVDRPSDGSITFSVDLSPMCCMGFEYAQPVSTLSGAETTGGLGGGHTQAQDEMQKLLSNRIIRILERTFLNGGTIDAEALCIQSGKWVWRLHVDISVLDHGGNLVDASILSTIAALRHFRKPEVEFNEEMGGLPIVLHSDEREPTPLPLHHTPISTTFALFSDPTGATTTVSALVDPSHREELVHNGTITFSFNKYKEMCSLDFPGGELNPRQLISCANLAKEKCVELCNMLEKTLKEADEKAIVERLDRLVKKSNVNPDVQSRRNTSTMTSNNVPFLEKTNESSVNDSNLSAGPKTVVAAEEEKYRIQALDYAQGHVAAKVKENSIGNTSTSSATPTSLLEAMMKAVTPSTDSQMNSITTELSHHDADQQVVPLAAKHNDVIDTAASNNCMDDTTTADEVVDNAHVSMNAPDTNAPASSRGSKIIVKKDTSTEDIDDLTMAVKKRRKKKVKKK